MKNMADASPIPEDRPLSVREASLIRWMLEHGAPGAADFLPQLPDARVVSRCPCGCASVNFSIAGVSPPPGGLGILADFQFHTREGFLCGAFVFERAGLLAGLDVWSIDGPTVPSTLPAIEALEPLESGWHAEPVTGSDAAAASVADILDHRNRKPASGETVQSAPPGFLPTTLGGRLAVGLLSAAILPPAAVVAFLLPPDPLGENLGAFAFQVAFRGLMSAVVTLSVCGLVWAAFKPRWAGVLAWGSRRRLGLLLLVFYLAAGAWFAWPR